MTRVTETGFPRQTWCVHELHSFLGKLLSDHKLKYDFRYRAPAVRCVQLPFPSVNGLQNAVCPPPCHSARGDPAFICARGLPNPQGSHPASPASKPAASSPADGPPPPRGPLKETKFRQPDLDRKKGLKNAQKISIHFPPPRWVFEETPALRDLPFWAEQGCPSLKFVLSWIPFSSPTEILKLRSPWNGGMMHKNWQKSCGRANYHCPIKSVCQALSVFNRCTRLVCWGRRGSRWPRISLQSGSPASRCA